MTDAPVHPGEPPQEDRRFVQRIVALALIGFAAVGLFVPEARIATGAAASLFVVAAVALSQAGCRPPRSPLPPNDAATTDSVLVALLGAMPEPAFLVDERLCFRLGNEPARQSFGPMAAGDPIALRFRAPEVLAAAEDALVARERREAEYVDRLPENRSFGLDVLPIPVDGADRPPLLLFRFRDRTAERRIERMRVDFVANASHELRTPLASLLGFIETLQGPARNDPAAQKRFLEIMRQQAGRMSRLIDDLLSLSRIETKRRLTADDRADLVEIIRAVAAEMNSLAGEVGVELVTDLGGVVHLEVTGDRDELTRVFANLVENACRYASQGKRVIIGMTLRDGAAEAYVRDFGPGIEARHIPRLTERFYRARADVFPGGTGLGLSIVRNILLRHGTRLSIASSPGEGSTFSIRLKPTQDPAKS